jgi:hypothetical protein
MSKSNRNSNCKQDRNDIQNEDDSTVVTVCSMDREYYDGDDDENDDVDTEKQQQQLSPQTAPSILSATFERCYVDSSSPSQISSRTSPTGLQKRRSGIKLVSPVHKPQDELSPSSKTIIGEDTLNSNHVPPHLSPQPQRQQPQSLSKPCPCGSCRYCCSTMRYVWYRFIGRGVSSETRTKQYFLLFCLVIGTIVLCINKFDIANHYHELKVQNECNLDSMVVKASNNNYKTSIAYQALQMYVSTMTNQGEKTIVDETNNNNNNNATNLVSIPTSKVEVKIVEVHDKTYETFYQLFVPRLATGFCSYINNAINVVVPNNGAPTDSEEIEVAESSNETTSEYPEEPPKTRSSDELTKDANELEDSSDPVIVFNATDTTSSSENGNQSTTDISNIDGTMAYVVLDVAIDCTKLVRFSPIIYGTGDWLFWYYSMRYVALVQRDTSILFTCTDYALAKDIPKEYILPWLTGWFPSSSSYVTTASHDNDVGLLDYTNNSTSNSSSTSSNQTAKVTTMTNRHNSSSTGINSTVDSIPTGDASNTSSAPVPFESAASLYDTICIAKEDNDEDKTNKNVKFVPSLILPTIKQDLRRMTVGLIGLHSDPTHPINKYACDQMITALSNEVDTTLSSNASEIGDSYIVSNMTNPDIGQNNTGNTTTLNAAEPNTIDPMKNVYSVTASNGNPALSSKPVFDDVVIHFPCADAIESKSAATSSGSSILEQLDGFYKFSYVTKLISKDAKSIGILTQSLDNSNLVNTFEDTTDERCKRIIKSFADYITEHFQNYYFQSMSQHSNDTVVDSGIVEEVSTSGNTNNSADTSSVVSESLNSLEPMILPTITIYDDSHDVATVAVARMIMANQTIASASKLSILGSMATFGTAYIPRANVVDWLQMPIRTSETVVDHNDSNQRRHRSLKSPPITELQEKRNVHQRHRTKILHNDTSTLDETGFDSNFTESSFSERHSHHNYNTYHSNEHDENKGEMTTLLDEYSGTIQIVDGGSFLPMSNVTAIWTDPDGEDILLEWLLNNTFQIES